MLYKNNFYTRFNTPPTSVYGKKMSSDSLTVQSFAYESNINNLLKTSIDKEGRAIAQLTAVSSSLPSSDSKPQYGDFTMFNREKLIDAMNITAQAKQMFADLPSNIRDRFANDPTKLVAFINDKNNYDEAVKLGLCVARTNEQKIPPDAPKAQVTQITSE